MTRLGYVATTGAMVILAFALMVLTHSDGDSSSQTTWGSSFAMQDPDPGFWRDHPSASAKAPRLYAVGISDLVVTSRLTVLPHSGLELTNLGAPGSLILESGGLLLTGTEGIVELRRGASNVAMDLAPIGVGSRLERGDRIGFRSSATIALRNPEAAAVSLLVITERSDFSKGGALQ